MKDRAIIKVKIEDNSSVRATLSEYSAAVNYAIDVCWKQYKSYLKLYYACYGDLRQQFPQLQSQLVVTAIKRAYECCKRAESKPAFSGSIRYNHNRSFSIKDNILSISTINGRVKVPFIIPGYFKKYADWDITESELFMRGGKLYFNLGVAREVNINLGSVRNIVGVDFGINCIAATSDKRFFGNIKRQISRFRNLKARLQSTGTKSAKKHLKRLSGRQTRFTRNMNHVVSKKIIKSLTVSSLIVIEDLAGIGKKNRGRKFNGIMSNWSRFQLRQFIEYKAIRAGHIVTTISPEYTSQTCSHCGELGVRNKGFFHCNNCGYSCNSDLNASFNFIRRAKPLAFALGLQTVNQPIVANNDGDDIRCSNQSPEFSDKPTASVVGS